MRRRSTRSSHSLHLQTIDMKSINLIIGLIGLVLVSSSAARANDTANVRPIVPSMIKDSGKVVPSPAAKSAAPLHLPPPSPKPNLPINAGRKQGTANIAGSIGASGHKDGGLNGTEIKRHP